MGATGGQGKREARYFSRPGGFEQKGGAGMRNAECGMKTGRLEGVRLGNRTDQALGRFPVSVLIIFCISAD